MDSDRRKAYSKWRGMKSRCYTPSNPGYKNYGGRGIAVCKRWRDSFDAYYEDIGDPPFDGASTDRIDNDWHYEPSNVRWSTRSEQNNNRRYVHRITANGRTATITEWSQILNVPYRTLKTRVDKGWRHEDIVNRAVRTVKKLQVPGVSWCKRSKRWKAYMYKTRKHRIQLGTYTDWFEAVCARKSAEVMYG